MSDTESKRKKTNWTIVSIPLIIAVSLAIGIVVGSVFMTKIPVGVNDRKITSVLSLINSQYVDTLSIDELTELTLPKLLSDLDPHSAYIPAKDLDDVNNELGGSFTGVGIQFYIPSDTVVCVEIISGGPAEKAGLLPGDRIVSVNDTSFIGKTNEDVLKHLRGVKGTKVKVGIRRPGSRKTYIYTLTRDDIPVSSIDACYMIEDKIGYIKVNKFGTKTYNEFLTGLLRLKKEGAEKYIVDLRGNGGGLMESAILMVNEFMPNDRLIVSSKCREIRNNATVYSDGQGSFIDNELVVITNEYSASASEIFAGAMQDNDRGLVIGHRTFGKGLIQQQIELYDKSAIRLTIGRYYTPSGRCIQKNFKRGDDVGYNQELLDRYSNGELYSQDSIKVDKKDIYKTSGGRTVYGGGGIIPDIFVADDTTYITNYYVAVANAGLLQKYTNDFVDHHRTDLKKAGSAEKMLTMLPSDNALLQDFVQYAAKEGIVPRWYYINVSKKNILSALKSLIARGVFGAEAYYIIHNQTDNYVIQSVKALRSGKAQIPITEENIKNGKKKDGQKRTSK